MASLSGVVVSVFPSDGAEGVPLVANINILFDREMDEESIINGGIFVEGADTDELIVSEFPQIIAPGDELNVFESPAYAGLMAGTFSFKRISPTSVTEVTTLDTTGNGELYRTRATFTSTFPFKKATDYRIYIVGDPNVSDDDMFGIRSRSVFDPVADGSNTGTGSLIAGGTYSDTVQDVINIQFTSGGIIGTARFEWWKNSEPLNISDPIIATYNKINLTDGIWISFSDGTYTENDLFTVVLQPSETFSDTLVAEFSTGNGSIAAVPTTSSTSVTGGQLSPLSTGTAFTIIKTTPTDFGTNLKPELAKTIIIEFSSDIDSSTITDSTVTVVAEPVSDHPAAGILSPNGPIAKTLTVSGTKLIITL